MLTFFKRHWKRLLIRCEVIMVSILRFCFAICTLGFCRSSVRKTSRGIYQNVLINPRRESVFRDAALCFF